MRTWRAICSVNESLVQTLRARFSRFAADDLTHWNKASVATPEETKEAAANYTT
jgi:hypothetical protein